MSSVGCLNEPQISLLQGCDVESRVPFVCLLGGFDDSVDIFRRTMQRCISQKQPFYSGLVIYRHVHTYQHYTVFPDTNASFIHYLIRVTRYG